MAGLNDPPPPPHPLPPAPCAQNPNLHPNQYLPHQPPLTHPRSRSLTHTYHPCDRPPGPAGGARRFSVRQVEEVKLVLRLLPVFGATLLYWTIYMQVGVVGGGGWGGRARVGEAGGGMRVSG